MPARFLSLLAESLSSVLLPPVCPLCLSRRPTPPRSLCAACSADFFPLREPFCSVCAVPYAGVGPSHPCPRCLADPPEFSELRAWGLYRAGLLRAIHAFKYRRRLSLRRPLQRLAEEALETFAADGSPFSAVVPVPSRPARLRRRGFDLPAILSKAVAGRSGAAWKPLALAKVRDTPDLVGLGSKERFAAVAGAYAPRESLEGRVLLVDDVCTSTGTARECAKACREAGGESVSVLVLARTPLAVR
jgi:predicted amidophosphoribosyltransferase